MMPFLYDSYIIFKDHPTLLDIKEAIEFLKLNNILLYLSSMCVNQQIDLHLFSK